MWLRSASISPTTPLLFDSKLDSTFATAKTCVRKDAFDKAVVAIKKDLSKSLIRGIEAYKHLDKDLALSYLEDAVIASLPYEPVMKDLMLMEQMATACIYKARILLSGEALTYLHKALKLAPRLQLALELEEAVKIEFCPTV